MKRKRGVAEVDVIKRDAIERFCPVTSSGKKSQSEARKIEKWVDAFAEAMNGETPYKTVDEAVAALAPIAITLFGFIFRYALRKLAIAVIRFAWSRWNDPVSVTVGYSQ
jgi:hypothetical protein